MTHGIFVILSPTGRRIPNFNDMYGRYYYTYIMSNRHHTVYYIGVTNTIERRAIEHKSKQNPNSFTTKYNINELLYFEEYSNPNDAIAREKQLKGWTRQKKIDLIKNTNPDMRDLFDSDIK